MSFWRKSLGAQGEKRAEAHLKKNGYRIIDKNVRSRFGEIDLIAMDGETLAFCEVRTRGGQMLDEAAESVNFGKQQRLAQLAAAYLQQHSELADAPCRFDVILLQKVGPDWSIELLTDAFRPGW